MLLNDWSASSNCSLCKISWNLLKSNNRRKAKQTQKQNVRRSLLKTPSPLPSSLCLCSSFSVRLEALLDLLLCLSQSGARSNDSSDQATLFLRRSFPPGLATGSAKLKVREVQAGEGGVVLQRVSQSLQAASSNGNWEMPSEESEEENPAPEHQRHLPDN